MRDFVVLADSTCDLSKELREKYGIDYVAMNYIIDDVEYVASLDWESHSYKDFYNLMRSGTRVFTTQVPKNVYLEKFTEIAKQGKDVVYISCSSALSGSINIARMAADEVSKEYPDVQIFCIDSLISSLGQGYMLIKASELKAQGKSAEETAKYIEETKLCVNQCGTVESLEYLKRAGRVKASKAFFGNLFGVKPIIISDIKGQNYAYKKAKGVNNARIAIAEHIKEAANGTYDTLYISHADCIESADAIKDEILKIAPFKDVVTGVIGPIVGASVGPGTVIAFCFGSEVTIEGKE